MKAFATLLAALCVCGCPRPAATSEAPTNAEGADTGTTTLDAKGPAVKSIGTASMDEEGTLFLLLRAEGPDAEGHGVLRYFPSSANYMAILDHVGGMVPGEIKPVFPWPEDQ
jgi:hypothetical protein